MNVRMCVLVTAASLMLAPGSSSADQAGPPSGAAASANFGLGSPGGIFGIMGRIELGSRIFVEADAGWGTSGQELGGGIGLTLMRERAPTAKLGMATARLIGSIIYTHSTLAKDMKPVIEPLPELVLGAGSYHWIALMTGGDIKLDSGLYILAEIGLTARVGFEAENPNAPRPDDTISPAIRGGVGFHY